MICSFHAFAASAERIDDSDELAVRAVPLDNIKEQAF